MKKMFEKKMVTSGTLVFAMAISSFSFALSAEAYEVEQRAQQMDRVELREQRETREMPAIPQEVREVERTEMVEGIDQRPTAEDIAERERRAVEIRREALMQREQEREARITQTLTTTREKVQMVREDLSRGTITSREDLVQRRAELEREVYERAKEGIVTAIQNMERALLNSMMRLSDNIIPRIESRISLMEEEGLSVERAKDLLSHAQEHLDNARRILGGLPEKIDAVNSATNKVELREAFAEARELVTRAREEVREARAELAEVLQVLRSL